MQNKNSHTLFDFMYPSGTNELWQDIVGYEDGGFVGYQYGGGATIESIMEEAGMTMTPEQRAQFENPDPTTVNRIAEDIQSGMEASGRGSAESVAGQGFIGSGHGTKAMADVRSEAVKRLGRATEDYQKGLASDTLGTAAGMVTEGAEFGKVDTGGDPYHVPTDDAGWAPPQGALDGNTYLFGGSTYYWSDSDNSWVTEGDWNRMQSDYDQYG
jgi:hypothetical protein